MRRIFNRKWKGIICGILVIAILIGACAGIAAIVKKDSKKISSSAFSRGDLDSKGEYIESNQAIYTAEAFECKGLKIEPDFEFKGSFDVYYYDENGYFIDSKKDMRYTYNEDYPLAYAARVVIHPEIPTDVKKDDFKIKFYEVLKYAKMLTITVDKDQTYNYDGCINLYDSTKVTADKTFIVTATPSDWSSTDLKDISAGQVAVTEKISVDGSCNTYDVYLYLESNESRYGCIALFNKDGSVVYQKGFGHNGYIYENFDPSSVTKPCWVKLTLEIPELESYDGVHAMVCIPVASDAGAPEVPCYIFGYNQ